MFFLFSRSRGFSLARARKQKRTLAADARPPLSAKKKTGCSFPVRLFSSQPDPITGVCVVIEDAFCVVVVEGVSKAIRRYEKLMTRRVDWASTGASYEETAEAVSNEDDAKRNACVCVWSGTTASPAFEGAFRFETFRSHASARARFERVGLAHFFDAAAGAVAAADEAAEAED